MECTTNLNTKSVEAEKTSPPQADNDFHLHFSTISKSFINILSCTVRQALESGHGHGACISALNWQSHDELNLIMHGCVIYFVRLCVWATSRGVLKLANTFVDFSPLLQLSVLLVEPFPVLAVLLREQPAG